jgi:hypothetical protein
VFATILPGCVPDASLSRLDQPDGGLLPAAKCNNAINAFLTLLAVTEW